MSPEPMSLGSPTQSPGGGGHSQTPQPYLPQFLLGDMNNSGLGASPLHLPHHLGGGSGGRQPIPQQQQHGNNYFLNHHQQPYGSGSGGGGGGPGGYGGGGGSQKYWHHNPGSNSNSPPRSGSGSNFLLPHHHHHHHHSSLIQAPGLGRTYSMNAHDYGHMRAGRFFLLLSLLILFSNYSEAYFVVCFFFV